MLDRNAVLSQGKRPVEFGRDTVFFLSVFLVALVVFGAGAGAWVYAEGQAEAQEVGASE